jgi:hypothetical protein
MKETYDRSQDPGNFETGWAFLKLGNGYTTLGVQKVELRPQCIGPFEITEILSQGRAYRFKLPHHYAIHDLISIAHLELAPYPRNDTYERAIHIEDLTQVYHDGQTEWELEKLLKKRTLGRNKEPEYLGRWKDCGSEWDHWLKLCDLDNAK